MQSVQEGFSIFVQGSYILEEFIWSFPYWFGYVLNIMDSLQNLSFLEAINIRNDFSARFEIEVFQQLSRPKFLTQYSAIFSYITILLINLFLICCIIFIKLLKQKTKNILNQISKLFYSSLQIRIILIFINVMINFIQNGFGYIMIEICFQEILKNQTNIVLLIIYTAIIVEIIFLIPLLSSMFQYNWALNLKKEYLYINLTNFSFIKIFIRYIQLVFYLMDTKFIVVQYLQIVLPILSSLISIYFIIKKKLFISCIYQEALLLINIIQTLIAFQFLIKFTIQKFDYELLWLILSIIPFSYCKHYIKRANQQDFLNYSQVPIENTNSVLFLIKLNQQRSINNFNQIISLMLLQKHQKICNNLKCNCFNYLTQNIEKLSMEIYINDLQRFYENQLNENSGQFSKNQLIFSYLQILFFERKYLQVFKYFQIIFQSQHKPKSKFLNSYLITQQTVSNKMFQISSQSKLTILKAAQSFMRVDLQQTFGNQRNIQNVGHQKNLQFIQDYLYQEDQKRKLQQIIMNILKQKINYFDTKQRQINSNIENKQSYDLINTLSLGLKQIQNSCYVQNYKKQNIEVFYKMELLNDQISAYHCGTLNSQQDQTSNLLQDETFNNEISYMIIQICDMDKINVLRSKIFSLAFLDFKNSQNFNDLLPTFIQKQHPKFINEFISGKNNKFYQQFNNSFIQLQTGLVQKIDLMMDVYRINSFSIEMSVFFKKKNQYTYNIIIDQNSNVISFDEILFCDVFGFQNNFAHYFIGINVQFIFPRFFTQNLSSNSFVRQEAYFLDPSKFEDDHLYHKKINKIWNEKYLNMYHLELKIDLEFLNQGYQVLTIQNIKQIVINTDISFSQQIENFQSQRDKIKADESIIIDKPFDQENINFDECINSQQGQSKQEYYDLVQQAEINTNLVYQQFQSSQQYFIDKEIQQSLAEDNKSEKQHYEFKKKQTEKATSQQSVLSLIEKSEYYKQFNLVYELSNSNKKPSTLIYMIVLILLLIGTSIIGFGMYLYEIDLFHTYKEDFELLKIKDTIFYPSLSFQMIRFSQVNYNIELILNIISQEKYEELLQFPKSKLIGSYSIFKQGILDVFSQQKFNELFSDKILTLHFLESNGIGQIKTLSMQSGLSILLNYQFEVQNAYLINGQADYESTYFYFQYKNFPILYNLLTEINDVVLNDSTERAIYSSQKITVLFISITVFLFIFEIGVMYFNYRFQFQKGKFKYLLKIQDPHFIQLELQRLQQLYVLIEKNFNLVLNYKLNIREKDEYFKKMIIGQQNQKFKKKYNIEIKNKIQPFHVFVKLFQLIFSFTIFCIYFLEIEDSYQRFSLTEKFYQSLIDLNINTLVIYSTREILYYKQIFTFLDQKDFDGYYELSLKSLHNLENYISNLWSLSDDRYFVDQSFIDQMTLFSEGNICEELNKIKQINKTICSKSLSGILQKGFSPTLIHLKNEITSEIASTNFTNRINYPILELEGIYFLSQSLQYLLENFFYYFTSYNTNVEIQYSIIVTSCLLFTLLYGFFLLKYIQIFEWKNFQLLMKFLYIKPQSAIILDDSFQRNTRMFLKNDNLI